MIVRWRVVTQALLEQADLQLGDSVLYLGRDHANITAAARQRHPGARIVGLDWGDGAHRDDIGSPMGRDLMDHLPHSAESFNVVISSRSLRRLHRSAKLSLLTEIRRVLRPGGELHVADWGQPSNLIMQTAVLPVQLLNGFEAMADNLAGRIADLMREAGFRDVAEDGHFDTLLGTIRLYSGVKPTSSRSADPVARWPSARS